MVLENFLYTENHEWVKVEGEMAYFGITDYAQHELGDIVYFEFAEKYIKIPIIALISCGLPFEIIENEIENYAYVDKDYLTDDLNNYIACRAEGSSMEPDINDGDIILLKRKTSWDEANNRIAAVRINNEATLKNVQIDSDNKLIILTPNNKAHKTLVIKEDLTDNVILVGVCLMLVRELW